MLDVVSPVPLGDSWVLPADRTQLAVAHHDLGQVVVDGPQQGERSVQSGYGVYAQQVLVVGDAIAQAP